MSRFRATTVTEFSRHCLLAGALAAALAAPTPASAFFQQTKLEGTVGTDLGGVWLSVQNIMPEFRVTFPKPSGGSALPLTVGPIPPDLQPVAGKNNAGVVITNCPDGPFCGTNGILVGDIVVKVNAHEVNTVEDFQKALDDLPPTVMLSIRRPALKLTTARLLKIRYVAEGKEVEGASVAEEQVDVRVLDVALPFAAQLDESRNTHNLFQPTPADLEGLAAKWFALPVNDPLLLISAKHRFVAKDSFDEPLSGDRSLGDAKYALLMDMDGNPLQGGGAKIIDIYGIEALDAKALDGNYVTVTVASAPFPINIEFKGRFHMIRIADWSDKDDKIREDKDRTKKPAEDLSKYKTLPDVPASAKPAPKAAPKPGPKSTPTAK